MAVCPKCETEFVPEGKIARCPNCRATFAANPPKAKKKAKDPAKASRPNGKGAVKPAKPTPSEEDENLYGFAEETDLAEHRRAREEKEEEEKEDKKAISKPVIEVKRKNIGDLKVWAKVDRSMIFFLYGTLVWGARHLLHGLILFLGMINGPDYPRAVAEFLIRQNQPAFQLGHGDVLDRVSFTLAMLGGTDYVTASYVLMLLGTLLFWVQIGLWVAGYSIAWQGVDDVESGKSQLISLFSLAGINFVLSLLLVFLPLVGLYSYLPMPLWGTELAMCYHNVDRTTPLHIFWSYAPFWDTLITLITLACRAAEPTMIVYFIWTVAARLKDDRVELEGTAQMTVGTGCAITFLLLTVELFSLAGNSMTLIWLVRILYFLWYCFVILWIQRVAATIGKCRETFRFYFDPHSD
jgi:uncharacterized membrane protein